MLPLAAYSSHVGLHTRTGFQEKWEIDKIVDKHESIDPLIDTCRQSWLRSAAAATTANRGGMARRSTQQQGDGHCCQTRWQSTVRSILWWRWQAE